MSQKDLASRVKTCKFASYYRLAIVPVGAGQANCSLVGWERSIWYEPYGKYVRGELLRDVKAEVKQCE